MATATKNKRTLFASGAVSAAATQALTELDLSTALGALLTITVTNGGTGPTSDTTVTVYTGTVTTEENVFSEVLAGQANSEVYTFNFIIPPAAMFLGGDVTCGATNAITMEAIASELTSIG